MNKRAARGATWMDENYPGWYNRVDPEKLDPDSDTHCVIGQETGSFSRVMGSKYPLTTRYWDLACGQATPVYYAMIPFGLIATLCPLAWIVRHGFCRWSEKEREWLTAWRGEIMARIHRDADRYSRKDRVLVESSDLALSA